MADFTIIQEFRICVNFIAAFLRFFFILCKPYCRCFGLLFHGDLHLIIHLTVLSDRNICYACSAKDCTTVKRMFQTAKPNPEPTKFPDFICENGFIEHFEVTSSHSNRNGSAMRIEQDKLNKEAEKKKNNLISEMNETPCFSGKSVSTAKQHSEHSYDYFFKSFEKHWKDHIDHLNKYDKKYDTGIFMIQYNDSALDLYNNYSDCKNGIYYGDLMEKPKYRGYRLTHDEKTLELIYQSKDKVHYAAFYNNDGFNGKLCEIICVENIPEILKIIKGRYVFYCKELSSMISTYGISSPMPRFKEKS